MKQIFFPLFLLSATLTATSAQAWDPNEGAEWSAPKPRTMTMQNTMSWSRPQQTVLQPPTPGPRVPAAPTVISAPPIAYQPAPISYAPAAAAAPAPYTAPAPAQTYVAPPAYTPPPAPAPVYQAPAAQPYAVPMTQNAPQPSWQDSSMAGKPADRLALGVEAFYDNYREDSVDLDNKAIYGSITGDYAHFFDPRWFAGMDGRVSYGSNDYESSTGSIDGIPQWEFEGRAKGGYRFLVGNSTLDLYSGLGARYFRDNFKGESATVGGITYFGYDRRIFQAYIPIGLTQTNKMGNWTVRKNIEADALLYGNVSSRLEGTGLAVGNVENKQDPFSGLGIRGELTFANLDAQQRGWEFGPFIRYWYVDDSKDKFDPISAATYLEPENTRLQLGATVRYLF